MFPASSRPFSGRDSGSGKRGGLSSPEQSCGPRAPEPDDGSRAPEPSDANDSGSERASGNPPPSPPTSFSRVVSSEVPSSYKIPRRAEAVGVVAVVTDAATKKGPGPKSSLPFQWRGPSAAPFFDIPTLHSNAVIAKLCEHMGHVLSSAASGRDRDSEESRDEDRAEFDIPLPTFILKVAQAAKLTGGTLVLAMHYLTKIFELNHLTLSYTWVHRLVFVALMVAEKVAIDEPHSNLFWSEMVHGVIDLDVLNGLEVEMLVFLRWALDAPKSLVSDFCVALGLYDLDEEHNTFVGEVQLGQ